MKRVVLLYLIPAPKTHSQTAFCRMFVIGVISFVGHFWITAAASEEVLVVTAVENVNVTLNCTAKLKPGVEYRAVRWYKEGVDPRLTGLVSRTLSTGELRWYVDADTRISLDVPSRSLLLPPVSCKDSGVYQCYMAAPVGEQNRVGRVRLSVQGCPTDSPTIPERNGDDDVIICRFPYIGPSQTIYLVVGGAVGVLLLALFIFVLSYRTLKKALWQKTKPPGKEPYPDPYSPPEKQDLLWISAVGPAPQKSGISAA